MTSVFEPEQTDFLGAEGDPEKILLDSYRSSARLNGMRADGLQGENAHLRHQINLMHRSLSWRVTMPLRALRSLSLGRLPSGKPLKVASEELSELWHEGGLPAVRQALGKKAAVYRRQRMEVRQARKKAGLKIDPSVAEAAASPESATEEERSALSSPGRKQASEALYDDVLDLRATPLAPRILIIAEMSLRQCAKYRVWQKRDAFEALGWTVQVVDWRDIVVAMSALQLCTHVIFYRVPGFDDALKLVHEAHRLRLKPRWEVDDLIFDADEYRQNGNIDSLPRSERDLLMSGVVLFRKCMQACGRGVASTRALAGAMKAAGLSDVDIVENALDRETLEIAASLPPYSGSDDGRVWVSYGSGTNTHDEDFRQAEAGLLAAMEEEPRLCLRVIGQLTLSPAFDAFGDRIDRLTELSYRDYLQALSETDIAIAPLEATLFNDCKSNIKFLEAAVVRVAAVCSPRDAFLAVIRNGENGLLAVTTDEWRQAFLTLARDPALRARLADVAHGDVLDRYAPDAMAQTQVRALFGMPPAPRKRDRLRVMVANVYFAPRSFGGATIIAEEMAYRLKEQGVEVGVLTSRPHLEGRLSGNIRYVTNGVDVLSAIVPGDSDVIASLDNPHMAEQFAGWLEAYQPDVVHIHAAQGLGTAMLRLCQERGVPYVLTLHDAWWLCDRQFMVREDGKYCFQTRIDERVCQACLPHARHLEDRRVIMHQALAEAALLISPSEAHRQLYLANGVEPARIVVNRNGFRWPERPHCRRERGAPLRFGFVGGTEAVKGYPTLRKCMQSLKRGDWELVLVDNKLNLGFASIHPEDWSVRGTVRIVPAYGQDGLDDFYDRIDVLLFPSQWKESYGLTVREALARDVWVVTTAPGGQSEDVVDGVNGTYLPLDGKAQTLARAIEALLDSPERFEGYVNPFKDRLATYEQQASELLGYLQDVARDAS
ncbi:glycosyltransferase [Gluconobacter morbifer]|uniref:Glycosyltransferase n=1 Tax=Gluconobacter morbifer G707 TaxID=1088869 RepID=G6XKK8_9PROT|nr:glycosyltransferase [Gluconobacter morbifer]EHH67804.1 glycosyltransferase [Gluconobacter morbifer G707]